MSRAYPIQFISVDRGFLLLNWPNEIDRHINQDVLRIASHLRNQTIPGVLDVVPAYCSLAVFFDDVLVSGEELIQIIDATKFGSIERLKENETAIEVPICYDLAFGIDLEEVCDRNQLKINELIQLYSKNKYRIYFMGFLPGFMYLGDLDERLHCPRRSSPRSKVPAGAVGIGGIQTGIYPIESPGGWNIIGRCPLKLFDSGMSDPRRFEAGNFIRFSEIDKKEYFKIYKSEYS